MLLRECSVLIISDYGKHSLNREIIKDYAEQYYQHVKAFPRYISATHSLCEDISKRKILLGEFRS